MRLCLCRGRERGRAGCRGEVQRKGNRQKTGGKNFKCTLQDRGEESYGEKRKLTEKMMENEERGKRGINIPNISDQNVRKE